MNWLTSVWTWIDDPNHQKLLAYISSGLAAIGAGWQWYRKNFKKLPVVTTSGGSISAGGDVSAKASGKGASTLINTASTIAITYGITPEQFADGLKQREQEVRTELAGVIVADKEKITLLERELADVQAKLKNLDIALEEQKTKLSQAYRSLDDNFKQEVPREQLEQAQQALARGQIDDAKKIFQEVRQGKKKAEERIKLVAEASYQLAQLAEGCIDYVAAYQYSKEAIELQPDNPLYLHNAGLIAHTIGHYSEAERFFMRSLAIWEKSLGPDHPYVARNFNNLAELYKAQSLHAKAEPLYLRALDILTKALGPDHLHLAPSLNNLAGLYLTQGQYAKAEPLYEKSLGIRKKALGPDHPHVATSLNNLAELYLTQGQHAEAELLCKRSLRIWEKALGPDHPDVAVSLNNFAKLYRVQGQYVEAEALLQRSLAIWEKALGVDHPDVAASLNNLAELYREQSRYTEAEDLFQRSLIICEKTLGTDHPHVATCLNNLSSLYYAQNQYAKAEPIYKRSLAIWEKTLGLDHPHMVTSLLNYATLLRKLDRVAEAKAMEARAKTIQAKS